MLQLVFSIQRPCSLLEGVWHSELCVYLSGVPVTLFTKRSTVARVWNAEFRFDSWLNQWNGSEPSPPSKCAFNLWYKMHTKGLCVREVFLFWQVVYTPPSPFFLYSAFMLKCLIFNPVWCILLFCFLCVLRCILSDVLNMFGHTLVSPLGLWMIKGSALQTCVWMKSL